jgi:hypothetical protein
MRSFALIPTAHFQVKWVPVHRFENAPYPERPTSPFAVNKGFKPAIIADRRRPKGRRLQLDKSVILQ